MKYLVLVLIVGILACKNINTDKQVNVLWEYIPHNHQINRDQQANTLIYGYQSILKGLASNDSSFLFQAASQLLLNTDSIIANIPKSDSLNQKLIVSEMNGLNGELAALLMESSPVALNKAVQMVSIELIHYLGQIGYQKSSIYIFDIPVDQQESLVWFSLSKTSKNPYNGQDKQIYTATQILQEP